MKEKKPTPHQSHENSNSVASSQRLEKAQISTAEGQTYSLSTFGEKCENGNPHASKGPISSGSGTTDGKKHSKPLGSEESLGRTKHSKVLGSEESLGRTKHSKVLDGGDCDLVCRMIKREKESTKPELDSELLDFLKIRGN